MPDFSNKNIKGLTRIMSVATGCICLLILYICTFLAILNGKISPEILGSLNGLTIGGGIIGLALVLFWIIKTGLRG